MEPEDAAIPTLKQMEDYLLEVLHSQSATHDNDEQPNSGTSTSADTNTELGSLTVSTHRVKVTEAI